ncbi:MAG: hypothetical protein NUW07_04350, partial [Candidatus Saccharicenans sp.]|nr:hypothetical protein [Candidatus Saccharicenans sp.]
ATPDVRARMITLQTKPAGLVQPLPELSNMIIEPVSIIAGPDLKPLILAQNPAVADYLEKAPDLIERLEKDGLYQNGGWRVMKRSVAVYQKGRLVYDCLAIKIISGTSMNKPS